ncbi:alpha/beta hydrolase [Streptomyces sp. NBC_00094]|uniref:alpha/beta hydrolase n=1 Tax=Streptomyces sp. NBC_00094 TaxID=2903620 RepID=UPI002258CD23|nr:alpha/beta hydrolase [Streptomyces sp. NBC_00094]MCX5392256.1 alpha/beta hydrolase [Streptomyces sp. NBC_00094]
MTTNRGRKALLLALSTAAVAGVALSGSGAAAAAAAVGAGLNWGDCSPAVKPLPGQRCATLSVPLDYARPDGEQIQLAVSRLPSTRPEARRGTLMVIPGGPGSSGVQRLGQKGAALAKEMDGAYDLVAFDPRGIGGSAKARCGLDEGDRWMMTLRSWPDADGGIEENVARSKRIAEACARNGGAMLRGLTTANQVRDMERLRQALGERKLSAWSVSYGTYVAAAYAEKYPHRTDRWVLDSSSDPDPKQVARGWLEGMAWGAEDRFPDFAAYAAHPDRAAEGLRLAERPEDVRAVIMELAARLDREPHASVVPGAPGAPVTPGPPLTGSMLLQALQLALYSDGAFPAFTQLVTEALDPQGEPVLPRELAGAMPDDAAAITVGVICNDVDWPASVPAYERAVAADRERFPLTAGMTANITPCAFWKGGAVEKPVRITDRGPSDVLMIQNLRDPATPYAKGLRMRAALGERARLVSVDHGGHGVYLGNGNACGDAAVTRYLTEGVRPSEDVLCR